MTDIEIIKALERCANNLGCEKCPVNWLKGSRGLCSSALIEWAYQLINQRGYRTMV